MMRSLRIVSIAVVSLAVLALCDAAWAQPGPGGGGRGFGRMPRMSVTMMYGFLLNAPTVQKDLDLVDDQKAKLKEINDKARAAMQELWGQMRGLAPEDYATKGAEIGKKMEAQGEKNTKAIEGVLLPDQLKRLRAIAIQRMGVMALGDKSVQKDLKLTDDQVAKIKSIGEETMKAMGEKMGELRDSGASRDEMRKGREQITKEGEKKVMVVLSDDQKTKLDKMKGKELKIPDSELRMFGGRGGRGGRGGQGGGGGGGGGNPPPVD
jgi:Spy/CpxP family protein refolding chaperone